MSHQLSFVIITGISGAGKTTVLRCFEDLGYFCVDNLPPLLIPRFIELCVNSKAKIDSIALVLDVRVGSFFDDIIPSLNYIEESGFESRILFLDASNETIIRRFSETRRRHPLDDKGTIQEEIEAEREQLDKIREIADKIIDTSHLSQKQLREEIAAEFDRCWGTESLLISLYSFGYKYGLPHDVDLVFDVRFLPNPYYVEALKSCTGRDSAVRDFVLKWPVTREFESKLFDLISFLLPYYVEEGKSYLSIAIGCTGGKHRSVVLTNELGNFLRDKNYRVLIRHRDIDKDQTGDDQ